MGLLGEMEMDEEWGRARSKEAGSTEERHGSGLFSWFHFGFTHFFFSVNAGNIHARVS